MDPIYIAVILGASGLGAGYFCFTLIVKFLPHLEKRENFGQKEELLKEARRQQHVILEDARGQAGDHEALLREELEASIAEQKELLRSEEEELEAQELYYQQELKRVEKSEASAKAREKQVRESEDALQHAVNELDQSHDHLVEALSRAADSDAKVLSQSLQNQLTDSRQLECQKVLKSLTEELSSSSRKRAQRILDRTHSRYAPEFIWPKASNVVEVSSPKVLEPLMEEDCLLIKELTELSGANIKVITSNQDSPQNGIIKVAGGYGIYREAAKLVLGEIANNPANWRRAKNLYQRHQNKLEAEAVMLGKRAVTYLGLEGIHPEIQKLVGALNWRTSYRQNQWHHTVEVAVLAGIIASELGVNPEEAKRVGLLHDIGKAIDYRIEGSHAVISGDYADRYGENRVICDTVMSHHADLLVETPLAYVLRAADTLSGARPGARVNLEEGYQIRLDAIAEVVKSFQGISDLAIMNGGREVHVQVNHRKVNESDVRGLTEAIARKIEQDVAYPGQIKVMVSRTFESVSVA